VTVVAGDFVPLTPSFTAVTVTVYSSPSFN